MSDEDFLAAAVEPVKEHFRSTQLTPNTVLAAHMRSIGLKPIGVPWQRAKAALQQGHDFAIAAQLAQGRALIESPGETVLATPAATKPRGDLRPESEPMRGVPSRSSGDDDPEPGAGTSPRTGESQPERPLITPVEQRDGSFSGEPLTWVPKVFGPGDIDGDGAKRLLGTPNIPLVSVLVRETAQNSWDARLATVPVRFALHLRQLSQTESTTLREGVFTGASTGLGLREVLDEDAVWVLEVSDRGTKGLGGPTRNDLDVQPGITTNFIDLIFNIGAPRDVHLGGGTYGFGKTIAYQVSSCGTVLFWSRSHEESGVEDRLIGSAIGRSFSDGMKRHTGRHWWGRVDPQEARIEPLVGEAAAGLARHIFRDGFLPHETGTSFLIVDPQLGGRTRDEDAGRLAEAVAWHLWPKLVDDDSDRTPMGIRILFNGKIVPIPPPEAHPTLAGYADALQSVRAIQRGTQHTPKFNTEVMEVRSYRPEKLLGHLALTRYPYRPPTDKPTDEVAAISGPASHVALMRHDAELLVKYDPKQRLEADGLQWAGVFKPVAAVDDSFALAEPPAHDDWVPDAMQDRAMKSEVRVALTRVRELVKDFLAPASGSANESPRRSVAALADSLSHLVGGLPGSGPSPRPPGSGAKRSSKPQVRTVEHVKGFSREGWDLVAVRCLVKAQAGASVAVSSRVGVGVEGGSDNSPDLVRTIGWSMERPELGAETSSTLVEKPPPLKDGQEVWLVLESARDLAVDVNVNAALVE